MRFLTHLVVQSIGDEWLLVETLRLRVDLDEIIDVPAGYVTDFFSVPRILWWLFPRDGRGRAAAVVHDYIYTDLCRVYTRAEADAIFREALRVKGVSSWRRWAMWAGVRVGGRGNWT